LSPITYFLLSSIVSYHLLSAIPFLCLLQRGLDEGGSSREASKDGDVTHSTLIVTAVRPSVRPVCESTGRKTHEWVGRYARTGTVDIVLVW